MCVVGISYSAEPKNNTESKTEKQNTAKPHYKRVCQTGMQRTQKNKKAQNRSTKGFEPNAKKFSKNLKKR